MVGAPVGAGTSPVLSPGTEPAFGLGLSRERDGPWGALRVPASPADWRGVARGSLRCAQREVIYARLRGEGRGLRRGLPKRISDHPAPGWWGGGG